MVLTAHLAIFDRFWVLPAGQKAEVSPELLKLASFCANYSHFQAEAADLADHCKVHHEVLALSQTKGEWDSSFNFIRMLSYA